jgi:DNA-binding MltR family transcriptional regulator
MFISNSDAIQNAIFFSRDAPLSSFARKIEMAYALGIISREYHRELTCVRRIRNAFAHTSNPIAFTDEAIRTECEKLVLVPRPRQPANMPRRRFVDSACAMLAGIGRTALALEEQNQRATAKRVSETTSAANTPITNPDGTLIKR